MNATNIYLALCLARQHNDCSLYKLHTTYRLTYNETLEAVSYLHELGVVNFDGKNFSIIRPINLVQLSSLYKVIHHRSCILDELDIQAYKNRATTAHSLYAPNREKLDRSLLLDE